MPRNGRYKRYAQVAGMDEAGEVVEEVRVEAACPLAFPTLV